MSQGFLRKRAQTFVTWIRKQKQALMVGRDEAHPDASPKEMVARLVSVLSRLPPDGADAVTGAPT